MIRKTETGAAEFAASRRQAVHTALASALLLLVGRAAAADTGAQGFELVTTAEAQREALAARAAAAAPPQPHTRGVPPPASDPLPAMEVITPAGEAAVSSPLRLEVVFRPAADARIVPNSFRVLYGVLKIDLTERLQPHARLSENGVVVEGAQMPQGTHRLLLRVADDKGRTAEQGIVFRVTRRP